MFINLFQRKTIFFDLFDRHSSLIVESAHELVFSLLHCKDLQTSNQIKKLEQQADAVASECIELLHKTFITPLDRDQIFQLISHLDDIIDSIDASADCLLLHEINQTTPELLTLSQILYDSAEEVQKSVKNLRNLTESKALRSTCARVRKLEGEADKVLYAALKRLFQEEPDARKIIIWKELYESIEIATDRCADVADVIEGILLENE